MSITNRDGKSENAEMGEEFAKRSNLKWLRKDNIDFSRSLNRSSTTIRSVASVLAMQTIVAGATLLHTYDTFAAGRVYFNNFESGGSIGKCSIGGTAADGGRPYAGGGMAICNWDGIRKAANWADPQADLTFDVDFRYNTEFFLRFKQRADRDYDSPSTGAKWFRFGPNSIWQLDGDSVHFQMCSTNACGGQSMNKWSRELADAIYSKQWHEVEMYFRKGSNGKIIIWKDGAVIAEYTGDTGTSDWSPLHVGSNWSVNPGWDHDANNHRYVDDLEIYSDAGSGASGSMADGTASAGGSSPPPPPNANPTPVPNSSGPLAPPSNLRVVP